MSSKPTEELRNDGATHSTAYYFIEGINETGIEYLFCNMGTDHAPIIEAFAEREQRGEIVPKIVLCPHENTAAHMAMGFAAVSGRGQGVMVHVDVGTANVAMAMHNMYRSRLPVLLIAGKAPFTSHNELLGSRDNYVNFVQEPYDQGSLVRPYVKWEWTLPSGVVVKEALRRAHTVMESQPAGPVYLMMHRETLTEQWQADQIKSYASAQHGAASAGVAPPALIEQLIDRILCAENPILICSYAGRSHATAKAIEELALLAGVAVFEGFQTSNISHEFPCFLGFSPGERLRNADFGLLVDVDVPWFPADITPKAESFWAHVDIDTLKPGSPMWTFPADARIQGDSAAILQQILSELKCRATPAFLERAKERVKGLAAERSKWRNSVDALAHEKGSVGQINPSYVLAELGKRLDPHDLVFNEGIRNGGVVMSQLSRPEPNTLFTSAGGGLGWSGGMALGAKLAAPERMAVQVVGDGSFYFSVPTSTLSVSKKYGLPLLVLLLDNSGWNAVKQATLRVYPEGIARRSNSFQADLTEGVEFSKIAEAFGAYGERVENPDDVPAALERAIGEVRTGRTALLHIKVTKI